MISDIAIGEDVRQTGVMSVHDVVETPIVDAINTTRVTGVLLMSPERCDFTRDTATEGEFASGQVTGFNHVAATVIGGNNATSRVVVSTCGRYDTTITEGGFEQHVEAVHVIISGPLGIILMMERVTDCQDIFFTMIGAGVVVTGFRIKQVHGEPTSEQQVIATTGSVELLGVIRIATNKVA